MLKTLIDALLRWLGGNIKDTGRLEQENADLKAEIVILKRQLEDARKPDPTVDDVLDRMRRGPHG